MVTYYNVTYDKHSKTSYDRNMDANFNSQIRETSSPNDDQQLMTVCSPSCIILDNLESGIRTVSPIVSEYTTGSRSNYFRLYSTRSQVD